MRYPFLAPASRIDHSGANTPDRSPASIWGAAPAAGAPPLYAPAGESKLHGRDDSARSDGSDAASTPRSAAPAEDSAEYRRDAAMLVHQRAVSAAKGAVLLLYVARVSVIAFMRGRELLG
jgi:hypothetical protein